MAQGKTWEMLITRQVRANEHSFVQNFGRILDGLWKEFIKNYNVPFFEGEEHKERGGVEKGLTEPNLEGVAFRALVGPLVHFVLAS